MITDTNELTIESSGVLKELECGIKAENMGVILGILRSQIYSDKPLAIIREISCNARDAHVAAGNPNLPIKVSLPTTFESFLKIRDFGDGLSESDVEEIFINYGSSTKRGTNSQVGMFGIGSKSPFCYTDTFTVNSYQNGICYAYTLFIDETRRGKVSLMNKSDTTEPNGVEVVVPINYQDINLFKDKAVEFFKFWEILPNFENLDTVRKTIIETFRSAIPNFQGTNWKIFGDGQCYAVMGNVPYKLDKAALGVDNNVVNTILGKQCYLYFNIGDLDIVASREAVEFTDKSKKAITKLITDMFASIKDEIEKRFGTCKTLWDARCLYNEVFDMHGKYYYYRGLASNVLKFNGIPINDDRFIVPHNLSAAFSTYFKKSGRRYGSVSRVRRTNYCYELRAKGKHAVVLKDTKDTGLMNRIVPLIEDGHYTNIYLFEETDVEKWDDFVKGSTFDGPVLKFSALPKVNLQKYYPKDTTGLSSPYVGIRVLELKQPIVRHRTLDGYWDKAELDLAKDSGIYLPVKNYLAQGVAGGKVCDDYYDRPSNTVAQVLGCLKNCSVVIPDIYGIKLSAVAKAKANPNMVNFHTWAQEEVKKLMAKHDPSDYKQYQDFTDTPYYKVVTNKKLTAKLDPNLDISGFAKQVESLDKGSEIHAAVISLAATYGLSWKSNPTVSLEKESKKLEKKYPLLFRFANSLDGYYTNSGLIDDFVSYVNLINEKCSQSAGNTGAWQQTSPVAAT